jgi:hypothetical protein
MEMKELNIHTYIHTSGIAQWVESRQYPEDIAAVVESAFGKDSFDKILDDYQDRIEETKRKIISLADKLLPLMVKDLASDRSSQSGKMTADENALMKAIIIDRVNRVCSSLGVYTICGGVVHKCHRRTNYPGPDITTCLPISDDHIWYDYLGEQTRIREIGGTIIVMLSNEGVEYLNEIANRVSSYDTVTV